MAFCPLEKLSVMHTGYKKAFTLRNQALLLIQPNETPMLIENKCPHMDIRLDTGELLGNNVIRCRAHGIEFDLLSGKAQGALSDALPCLKKFTIIYEGAQLGVDDVSLIS